MKLYYTVAILLQILSAFLVDDQNKLAYMTHLLETTAGFTPSAKKPALFSSTMPGFWKKQASLRKMSPLSSR